MAKFCKKCGNQLRDEAMFCPKCGTKFEAQPTAPQQAAQQPVQRPAQPVQPTAQPVQQPAQNAAPAKQPKAPKGKKFPVATIIAIVLVVAIAAGYFTMAGIYKWQPLGDNAPFTFDKDDKEGEDKTEKSEDDGKDGKKDGGEKDKEDKTESEDGEDGEDKDKTETNGGAGDTTNPSDNSGSGANTVSLSSANVGDYVKFGKYEQDNNTSNGKEDIEWLILAKENGKALLISKYALDCQPFNTDRVQITWETCTLRIWLNDDFINNAFSSSEQSKISMTTVTAEENSIYDTDLGNDTNDKVFLLSESEAIKYFSSDNERLCAPTAYAISQGAFASGSYKTASDEPTGSWWLRNPGNYSYRACYVIIGGNVRNDGSNVDHNSNSVRPAMWVNL